VASDPALLAQHCAEAGYNEKAVHYWLAAGRQAWGRSAAAEAVALLRRGLALVPALPDTDRHRETELDLQITLGPALIMNRGWAAPELGEVYSRARQLASALNRPRALMFALWGQVTDHWARADLKRARQLADEMVRLGELSGDDPTRVLGCAAGGMACFHLGDFAAGRIYHEKALALYDPAHRASYSDLLSYDALVLLQTVSSWVLACLGHIDRALFQREPALEEARRLSHPPTLAFALGAAGWVTGSIVRLKPAWLLQCADKLLVLTTEHALEFDRRAALSWRGWSLAALGRADEGIPLLTAGVAGWRELGFTVWRPFLLTLLGEAHAIVRQSQAALGHLAEARCLAEETEARWCQAETLRLTGDVLLAEGDAGAAEAGYREALTLAHRQSAKLWELRTATSRARLWRDHGKCAEARDLLAPVYGWFTEGFGTPVLQEAKALLDELA
jgi:tetratricopeptide (TPR) repeat protein